MRLLAFMLAPRDDTGYQIAMSVPLPLHEDRPFPAEPSVWGLARELYGEVTRLPILSPHGHTDPAWFATNAPLGDAAIDLACTLPKRAYKL